MTPGVPRHRRSGRRRPELGPARGRGCVATWRLRAGCRAVRSSPRRRGLTGGPGARATRARPPGAAPRRAVRGDRPLGAGTCLRRARPGRCLSRSKRSRSQLRVAEPLRRGVRVSLGAFSTRRGRVETTSTRSGSRSCLPMPTSTTATTPAHTRRSERCSIWRARPSIRHCARASTGRSRARTSRKRRPDRAAEYAELAIATLKANEQTLEAARALQLLAFIENDRGNPEAALELVDEGEPIVAAAGKATDAAMFTVERARALSALGEGEEATKLLLGIVPRLSRGRAEGRSARLLPRSADIFRRAGRYRARPGALRACRRAGADPDRHVVAALTAMAEIHEEQGETGTWRSTSSSGRSRRAAPLLPRRRPEGQPVIPPLDRPSAPQRAWRSS